MLCLSDTDLVLKLAAMNIATEAFEAFGVERREIRITPELPRYLQFRAPAKHPIETVRRALAFIKGLKLVPDADLDYVERLGSVPDSIQYGERVLLASTARIRADFVIATGDKKCLRALAVAPDCEPIRERLKNRCVCFEQLVLGTVKMRGFEWVNKRAGTGCRCDECTMQAFGNGLGGIDEATCCRWLDGFIEELRGETGSLLVPRF
jgi:hypothetical protein